MRQLLSSHLLRSNGRFGTYIALPKKTMKRVNQMESRWYSNRIERVILDGFVCGWCDESFMCYIHGNNANTRWKHYSAIWT